MNCINALISAVAAAGMPAALAAAITLEPLVITPASDAAGWSTTSTWISADGRYTLFGSQARNLIAGQQLANTDRHLYVHDRVSGAVQIVNHVSGSPTTPCSGYSTPRSRAMSADGRWIGYDSSFTDLVDGVTAGGTDNVYLYDRSSGENRLISRLGSGLPIGRSTLIDMSVDGRWLLFTSSATSIVPGDGSTASLFLVERDDESGALVKIADRVGHYGGLSRVISADGRFAAVVSAQPGLDPAVPDLVCCPSIEPTHCGQPTARSTTHSTGPA